MEDDRLDIIYRQKSTRRGEVLPVKQSLIYVLTEFDKIKKNLKGDETKISENICRRIYHLIDEHNQKVASAINDKSHNAVKYKELLKEFGKEGKYFSQLCKDFDYTLQEKEFKNVHRNERLKRRKTDDNDLRYF